MKIISCALGTTLLISSIFLTIVKKNSDVFIKFKRLLTREQLKIYNEIIKERIMIYTIGMTTGLFVGGIFYYYNRKEKYALCKFLVIVYMLKLAIYYFYPKKPLMLYSLTTKAQTSAWADIYTEMKTKWRMSLLVGFLGYISISFFLDNCDKCTGLF
tara:strand:- start:938 stop:1408 length:471 start_codon:yes stop_codon:yes gene_type:complete